MSCRSFSLYQWKDIRAFCLNLSDALFKYLDLSNYLKSYMMHPERIPSILIAPILAGVIIFPSFTLLIPVLAQSSTEQGGESSQEESDTGADTGAARQDYQEFNTCLTEAEGGEGFATEDEIRECFQPIYIGGEASQDEESDEGSQDEESDEGSQDEESDEGSGDEGDNNTESGNSEN
jgi:hypothetical protein